MSHFSEHIPEKLLTENTNLAKFVTVLDLIQDYKDYIRFMGVKGISTPKLITNRAYLVKLIEDVVSFPVSDDLSFSEVYSLANNVSSIVRGSGGAEGISVLLEVLTGKTCTFTDLDLAYPQLNLTPDEIDPLRNQAQLPDGSDLLVAVNTPRKFLFLFEEATGFSTYYRTISIQIEGYDALTQAEKDYIDEVLNFFIFTNDSVIINIISI